MTHEDNERHFKAWLDKNSWRRDLQRLESEYGAALNRPPEGSQPTDRVNGSRPSLPYTDEFHFDAMSVIHYLGEALAYRPILRLCPRCRAPVRTHAGELPHLCTVCQELAP